MKQPTKDEIEAFAPVFIEKYGDTMERMKTVVSAVLNEYPRHERVLACNAMIGVAIGVMSVGIGLTEQEGDVLNAELQAIVFKWIELGVRRNPEPFMGGLPEPMKRGEGS